VVAAGMDGVNHQLDPGAPNNDNLYDYSAEQLARHGIGILPQNLGEALDALERDELLMNALGPIAHEFVRLKRMEWIEYMRHVSDWEVTSYLEFF
jgi:glutamine synthetase